MSNFLPYCRQTIDEGDIASVVEVLRGPWLTTGPKVDAFEAAFARHVGAAHAVACSSGTAALHLTALALELGEGDQVIVPSVTFAATANAVRFVGAEVIFADVDAESGLMTANTLEAALSKARPERLKAVFVVHLAGGTVEVPAIRRLLDERASGVRVVEDACHALGGTYPGGSGRLVPVGSHPLSAAAIFSLHPAKAMTTGEGGIVTTEDARCARRLRALRNHGFIREAGDFAQDDMAFAPDGRPNPWYHELHELGFNYRITDIQCALGLSQLEKLDTFVARRRELVNLYDELLQPLAPIVMPMARAGEGAPGWHLYSARIDFRAAAVDRGTLMRTLTESGVGTQVHYIPLHLQPYYRRLCGDCDLPGAVAYYERTLSLPLFPAMTDDDAARVVAALAACLGA